MRKASLPILSGLGILLLSIPGCNRQPAPRETVTIEPIQLRMFAPLPEVMPAREGGLSEERITLGRMLYYETRLSKDKDISCNTCHNLASYGVDGEPTSGGHKGQRGDRNSPTVYNAAGHIAQFWDGRARDVEEQAKGPVMNPVEMAMPSEDVVVATLKGIPGYVAAFKAAFPGQKDPVTFDNMGIAIGAFERKLITPSRWDKFLKGDQSALTEDEKAGFKVFTSAGCHSCHSGALVGGTLYQKLGIMRPYPDATDPGRFKVTKSESDRMMFKVPSLRNIAKTGPYFHNGKVATLEQAVNEMNEYQLGSKLTDREVKLVVTWLNALTGDIPADYIKPPVLPGATD